MTQSNQLQPCDPCHSWLNQKCLSRCSNELQVNLQFPPSDAIAQQHAIRLVDEDGGRREQPLQAPGGNSYPLIIRLETLAQTPAAEGKQLQQVRCGAVDTAAMLVPYDVLSHPLCWLLCVVQQANHM